MNDIKIPQTPFEKELKEIDRQLSLLAFDIFACVNGIETMTENEKIIAKKFFLLGRESR